MGISNLFEMFVFGPGCSEEDWIESNFRFVFQAEETVDLFLVLIADSFKD